MRMDEGISQILTTRTLPRPNKPDGVEYVADDHTSEPSRQNAGGTGWVATVVTVTVVTAACGYCTPRSCSMQLAGAPRSCHLDSKGRVHVLCQPPCFQSLEIQTSRSWRPVSGLQ